MKTIISLILIALIILPIPAYSQIERPITPGTLKNWDKLEEFISKIKPVDRNKRNTAEQREATKDLYFEVTEEDLENINSKLKPHIRVAPKLASNGKLYIPLDLLSDPITYPIGSILLELPVRNNVRFPEEVVE